MTTPFQQPGSAADETIIPGVVTPPSRPRTLRPGIRLTIRGRSMHLRGLRRPPTGVWRWLAILGPGMIAANAGNDAGAIATYSQIGAKFGYDLLWLLLLVTLSLAVVQEMCARLGAATGRGLLDLIRERFGIGWALLAVGVVLVANGGILVTEFVGAGAAAELFGVSRYYVIPAVVILLGAMMLAGNYGWVERVFLVLTLVFLTYPLAAILARPDWGAVARGAAIPTLHPDPDYLLLVVGLIGTTITPYQQVFQQSAVVEKGIAAEHYHVERLDTYAGAVFGNLIAAFIVIATAATLHVVGNTAIDTAAQAAQALRPVAGDLAQGLFALGLLGASLLAGAALPLATAYAVSEAFGFRKGVNLDFRRARVFFGVYVALIGAGALVALLPDVPVISLLIGMQVLNGILLPVILLFLLLLINDRRLVGSLGNNRLENVLGWGTLILVTGAVLVLLGQQLLGQLGIDLPGLGS